MLLSILNKLNTKNIYAATLLLHPQNMVSKLILRPSLSLFLALLLILFLPRYGYADESNVVNIGAIIDVNSRGGMEDKTAMEIAVQNFNNVSKTHKLSLHFMDSGKSPLRAASAAEELIKEKQVKVIVGMETWQETAIVADVVANHDHQLAVLSLAESASMNPSLASLRWPFLIQMPHNMSQQMSCIASTIHSYGWRKIVVIYEEDAYGGDSGVTSLLAEALRNSGSEIEYRMSLPPFSSMSNPEEVVKQELEKVLSSTQSRVFVLLRSSLPMAAHLFRQAKQIGLLGRDSVWIMTDSITSFLDSVNTSVITSMDGSLGIKAYYSEDTDSFQRFYGQFRARFRAEYQEEDYFEPGIRAIRAYNSIKVVTEAIDKMSESDGIDAKVLLETILSGNFTGLSGEAISFSVGGLEQNPRLRIVNVVGKRYKELDFWDGNGFSERIDGGESRESVGGLVNWPGNLNRVPKGWAMPTKTSPMKIGVPARTSFDKFVKVVATEVPQKLEYSGFCIELFYEVLAALEYALPYEFYPYNGTYDDLVEHVHNKTYDAIVGDVTILANRWEHVEFTQPYAESGLSMIVPVKSKESAWIFLKPFSLKMWLVTAASLLYTMFIVWFLEHHNNPAFKGPLKDQIGTALWFTFSSIFYAHSERINSNLARVVVVVWLFLVMVLTSSYTASLSSMLTVQKLEASPIDIESLKRSNATVGCDGDSFVRKYLEGVLGFNQSNIMNLDSQYKYDDEFKSGHISAAFLELPYEKVFINQYCKGYTATAPTYRFGGLAFVFQKGSPIAKDVSEAILKLSEDGKLKQLEEKWFAASAQCLTSNITDNNTESLKLQSFWALYVFSGATSTICLLLFLIILLIRYRRKSASQGTNLSDTKVWNKVADFARYFYIGEIQISLPITRAPTFAQSGDGDEWSSARWEYVSPEDTPEHHSHLEASSQSQPEIEML